MSSPENFIGLRWRLSNCWNDKIPLDFLNINLLTI